MRSKGVISRSTENRGRHPLGTNPAGWFGALRVRYVDGAPLIEDGSVTAHSAALAHLSLGWAVSYALRADVLNLFDSDDRDIEYFYASRLAGEPLEGVEDRFHRFEPRQLRVTPRSTCKRYAGAQVGHRKPTLRWPRKAACRA